MNVVERHYTVFETPFGFSAIVFNAASRHIKRVFLPQKDKSALIRRILETGPARKSVPKQAPAVVQDIQEYFRGRPITPRWESLDLEDFTPLQRRTLEAVAAVPYGQTRAYGEIARQIRRPRAARFVGAVMSRNPFPVVVPCHRIVRADGTPGGFGGGVALKKRLLALERQYAPRVSCVRAQSA